MKKSFHVILNTGVADDIQEAVDYYKNKEKSLGLKFYQSAKNTIKTLTDDALLYQIKYKDVRCVKVSIFPYLVHYVVDKKENLVRVYGVICTYKNPDKHWVE